MLGQKKLAVLDLVEGLHLAYAARTLQELGLVKRMRTPNTARNLARGGLDEEILRGILDYLVARTTLVRRKNSRYSISADFDSHAEFVLRLYVGAYGRSAARLRDSCADLEAARRSVDRRSQAEAFQPATHGAHYPMNGLTALVRQLRLTHLCDLGCGTGELLAELAVADRAFHGWGIERNLHACRTARHRLREFGLEGRIKILRADATDPSVALPREVRLQAQAITACDFANEMCREGGELLGRWLAKLKRVVPGRALLISDYYGRLGSGRKASRETLLHDFAQVISGQGTPPPNREGWRSLYRSAGCQLIHSLEDTTTTRFIHVVRL